MHCVCIYDIDDIIFNWARHIWWQHTVKWLVMCVLAEVADSYSLFCSTLSWPLACFSISIEFQLVLFFFENVSCLFIHTFCHERHYNWFVLLLNYVDLSSMQNIASWIYLLLSIYCCHISFPVLSLFPSPSSILGWFGGVSAQNNNNDHASMSVSTPAWLLQHYTVILQADGRKACLCLIVEATLLQDYL